MVNFGDLKTEGGLQSLNDHLVQSSYIEGYTPSQADVSVFDGVTKAPNNKYSHALRWYNHIFSYGNEKSQFPGVKSFLKTATPAPVAEDDDDDDVDLFGSDDEEEDAEAARIREERLKAYAAKKSVKPGPIAKSSILLDCKPWDDETDMKAMEDLIRTIELDGLRWGASKLNPLAYGIMKLSILVVVEDDKVSVDDLIERICSNEDVVQSVDIAAFNKI